MLPLSLPITTDKQKISLHMATKKHIYVLTGTACTESQGHDHIITVSMPLYHILTLRLHQQAQQEVCPSTQYLYPD